MRFRKGFYIFCFLMVFSDRALAISCIEVGQSKMGSGTALKFRSAASSQVMMSPSWYETYIGDLKYCLAWGESLTGGGYILSAKNSGDIGAFVFEGGSYSIFKISHPDIGLIMEVGPGGGPYKPVGVGYTDAGFTPAKDEKYTGMTMGLRYRFVALRKIQPGTFSVSVALGGGKVRAIGKTEGLYSSESSFGVNASQITVTNASCKLVLPGSVQLRSMNMALIPAVGGTMEVANFQMGISCGDSYAPYKVLYSMTDANNVANTSANLTIAAFDGAAQGYSLQLVDGGVPIKFAPEGAASSNATFFGSMGTAAGSLSKQMTVRYIRTGQKVSAGKVNAGASVVLSYD
jgi:hypothetical protein